MSNPTPIQPSTMSNQQIPLLFSTFQTHIPLKCISNFSNPRDLQNINILLGKWNLLMWDPVARDSNLIEVIEDYHCLLKTIESSKHSSI